MEQKCPYCKTSYKEILQTGFVGCERCYFELDGLKDALSRLYGDKKHRGRKGKTLGGDYGNI